MRTTRIKLVAALFAAIALASCSKDDDGVPMSILTIKASIAENAEKIAIDLLEFSVEATNSTTGKKYTTVTDANGQATLSVEEGIYNIKVEANREIPYQGKTPVRGLVENRTIKGKEVAVDVSLTISKPSSGWVFKELYFTGSKTPKGSLYYKDKYFELYNNSNQVLYADGISLCETSHMTVSSENPWASYITKGVVVQTIYTIPGSGMKYPVEPGTSIILADIGIDHTIENANSVNLSSADFEWYDNHSLDVDVPEVENLIKTYSNSLTIWTPHNRGFKSYFIFRQEESMDEFLTKNKVTFTNPNGSSGVAYLIPNSTILDAVEVSTPSDFASKAFATELDAGWTHAGDANEARFGKCVRRKIEKKEGNRVIYKDTNNSTEDFENTVTPKPRIYE
ncbi:MAG: DUF4876 domain-containing protein [Bacteroidales bacterium]|nr:DUF4876 domain-containing protein [Bacteroidales bacterium]MBN2748951.1 DUF4876 domain-containing protein [Bacteroidales bacterium]